jgi:hypothetical protein
VRANQRRCRKYPGHVDRIRTAKWSRYPPPVEERYESQLAQSTRVLDDVDTALQRLSDGTYGTCETCGTAILATDLELHATRRLCEQHLDLEPVAVLNTQS